MNTTTDRIKPDRPPILCDRPQELVIIDTHVDQWEILAAGVRPDCQVVVLHPHEDGIEQITELLEGEQDAKAPLSKGGWGDQFAYHTIHIISHGKPDTLYLGNSILNSETLQTRYSKAIQQWRHSLTDNAHILIYGCNVAANVETRYIASLHPSHTPHTLLKLLHQLTGAQIYANSQPTGNSKLGGTWNLQQISSEIGQSPCNRPISSSPDLPFSCQTLATYPHILVSFSTSIVSVGSYPTSVAIADLNGDNNLDLAVANLNSDNVSVMLGDGSGSFTETSFSVGDSPRTVVIADLNGDNNLDLAVTNRDSHNVSVMLGDGSGSFTETTFSVGQEPTSVAIADLNGDNNLDLAVTNSLSNNISVMLGDGSGNFTETNFSVGYFPESLAIADLNGDNHLDLAVTNRDSHNVSVMLGDGSGSFTETTFSVGQSPHSVAIADLNGDNHLDLAVANHQSDNVSVMLGDGSGSFTETTFSVGYNPFSVAIADLNGDNHLDLAVANHNSHNVSVMLGDGSGIFTETTFSVESYPISVAIADLNGDNNLDLAVANYESNTISILLNTTNQPPTSADTSITLDEDSSHTFAASDFPFTDLEGQTLQAVTITQLPTVGTFTLNGTAVTLNQVIALADLPNFVFTPVANANGTNYDSFKFTVNDVFSESASEYTLTVNVNPVNDLPIISTVSKSGIEDTDITFVESDFSAAFSDSVEQNS